MEDVFELLLEQALEYDVGAIHFWDMTYGEIVATLRAKKRKELRDFKQAISLNHSLADLIGSSVGRLMDKNAKFPTLEEAYPNLFTREITKEDKPLMSKEALQFKAGMINFANSQKKKERRNNDN